MKALSAKLSEHRAPASRRPVRSFHRPNVFGLSPFSSRNTEFSSRIGYIGGQDCRVVFTVAFDHPTIERKTTALHHRLGKSLASLSDRKCTRTTQRG